MNDFSSTEKKINLRNTCTNVTDNLEKRIGHTRPTWLDLAGSCVIPLYSLKYVIANKRGANYDLKGCFETELAKALTLGVGAALIYYKFLAPFHTN